MTLQQEIKNLIQLRDSLTACINRLGATESSASLANHKIVHEIQCKCCDYFNVKFEVLMSGSRERRIANCRAIAIYLCKRKLGKAITNRELGELFDCTPSNVSCSIWKASNWLTSSTNNFSIKIIETIMNYDKDIAHPRS